MELDRTLAGLRWLRDKMTCFACSGCGMEHNCSDDGCRIISSSTEQLQKLSRDLATSEAARTELWKQLVSARQELAEAKAERDAAVDDIVAIAKGGKTWMCPYCKHGAVKGHGIADCDLPHGGCKMPYTRFEWRGPQKEE